MEVVRATAQFQVVNVRRTAGRMRLDVMKFEKAAFPASTLRAHERAPASVSLPHGSPNCRWDVSRRSDPGPRGAWALHGREFGSLEIGEQQRDCTFDNLGEITVGDGVTQQILRSPELVVCGAGGSQLDPVAVGRERFQNDISQWRRWRWEDGSDARERH